MYSVYLGGVLLPVTPSKIQTKIKGQNKTINLINGEEVNIVKSAGLTEVSFECLLPMQKYYFAQYKSGFVPANYFTDQLEKKKKSKHSFNFTVFRTNYEGDHVIFKTNLIVTLEDYTIVEDSDQGGDLTVSIKLKQYVEFGLRTVMIQKDDAVSTKATVKNSRTSSKVIPNAYTVQKGDTMWIIAKKLLGNGAKCWNLAKLNGLSNPNLIRVGQVLMIQDVAASSDYSNSKSSNSKSNNLINIGTTVAANTLVSLGKSLNQNQISTSLGGMSLLLQNASDGDISKAGKTLTGSSGYSNIPISKEYLAGTVGLQALLGGKK